MSLDEFISRIEEEIKSPDWNNTKCKDGRGDRMNECMTCRELNIMEEIEQLDMDEKAKNRILDKAQRILETEEKMNKALIHCQDRIHQLERALIELSVDVGVLRERQMIEHGCN